MRYSLNERRYQVSVPPNTHSHRFVREFLGEQQNLGLVEYIPPRVSDLKPMEIAVVTAYVCQAVLGIDPKRLNASIVDRSLPPGTEVPLLPADGGDRVTYLVVYGKPQASDGGYILGRRRNKGLGYCNGDTVRLRPEHICLLLQCLEEKSGRSFLACGENP